ncbi:auxilin-like protein [Trifolium pratense]|uniref:Auxilin-like protein n=1 Tax=Trifolium pratense TaxID=57577 RepID=A0A2K3LRF3_TRIPR|nr:auxilin-like protein [Trifolium pratense]
MKKEELVNFLTDPQEERTTLRLADVLVYGWIEGKHACVDLSGVSPLVGLGVEDFTVGRAAFKTASSKMIVAGLVATLEEDE